MIPVDWHVSHWSWPQWALMVWIPIFLALVLWGCYVAWKNPGKKD